MKTVAILALCLVAQAFAAPLFEEFALWKSTHSKEYATAEEHDFRAKVYAYNKAKIEEHNKAGLPYTLAMNQFGDMTTEEFQILLLSPFKNFNKTEGIDYLPAENVDLPTEIDWRSKGYVTEVKNQAQCGSCWAFSTTGSLEGQHFRKTGKLVSLSEQNLVDCAGGQFGNQGCSGGLMDNAFNYIKANGGLDTEASYPYTAQDGTCQFKAKSVGATVTGFHDIPSGDEKALQNAVATVGPVSVAIDASHFSFQFYSTGVYNEVQCSPSALDHGVLVVGYGTESGKDYWLVKNSWGASWGLQGYIKMTRNGNNQCGIATSASYPLV